LQCLQPGSVAYCGVGIEPMCEGRDASPRAEGWVIGARSWAAHGAGSRHRGRCRHGMESGLIGDTARGLPRGVRLLVRRRPDCARIPLAAARWPTASQHPSLRVARLLAWP
jgi:hypothetical protein